MKSFCLLLVTALLASSSVVAQTNAFLTNGLVAYYTFSGNAADSSGNGNDGTESGVAFVPDRFGVSNRALSLAGNSGSNVRIQSTSLNLIGGFTVSVWFN